MVEVNGGCRYKGEERCVEAGTVGGEGCVVGDVDKKENEGRRGEVDVVRWERRGECETAAERTSNGFVSASGKMAHREEDEVGKENASFAPSPSGAFGGCH